jgi:dethiobiotin synthetase
MERGFFITGTDTGCGKTEITLGLMHELQQQGESVLGMKPVASGAHPTAEGLRNEDALRIQNQCSRQIPYEWVNPFVYEPPIAPHLAAEKSRHPIDLLTVIEGFTHLRGMADRVLVEGVGGWSVPLDHESTVGDLARRLKLPVILVVGLRLGCINHALLSEACIRQSGARLLGWIANQVEPGMDAREGNLSTLRQRLSAPCLGVVPWQECPTPEGIGGYLDIGSLCAGEH